MIKTPYSDFWAIVMALNGTQDIFALNERQYMQEMCKNVPIKYWAKGELEILLRKYRKTAFRYFGI